MRADPNDPAYLGALIYFHWAAQRLSFARAAEDLGVTASAVSHRIANLEGALNLRLFERGVREVRLTEDGRRLAVAAKQIWDTLKPATEALTQEKAVRVSVGPYLSTTWLMPRIAAFEAANPGVRVELIHRKEPPDLQARDLAIVWGQVSTKPPDAPLLFDTQVVPVLAPEAVDAAPFWSGDLQPLRYRTRETWRHWLRAAGAPLSFAARGEVMDDPTLILEAAVHRRGVALGFLPFIGTYFEAGRLVAAAHVRANAGLGYWLVAPPARAQAAGQFATWLRDQAGASVCSSG